MVNVLQEHLGYLADAVRVDRFRAAVGQAIRPGDRVADLGCGSGLLGLLCLQAGAAHVDFIDHGAILDIARQTMSRAGFADRATFIPERSQQVQLQNRVDVLACDHIGYFGFDYGVVPLLQDARRRFLAPGGRIIPSRLTLHLAAAASGSCRAVVDAWTAEVVPDAFHWVRECATNAVHPVQLTRDELMSDPADLGAIDLTADQPEFVSWTAELQVARDGVVHGLVGWFDCQLAGDVWMTNSPLAEHPIDRPQAFLPLGEAVRVHAGDRLKATIMARPFDHVVAWRGEFVSTGQRFTHSTLQGMLLSPEDLLRSDPGRVPRLSAEGLARMTVLGYCDGRRSVREIQEAVLRDHPALLPSEDEIARFVARVLGAETR
jgi:ubiquinone/menaquinone biosynthesis C-methylase UbiE